MSQILKFVAAMAAATLLTGCSWVNLGWVPWNRPEETPVIEPVEVAEDYEPPASRTGPERPATQPAESPTEDPTPQPADDESAVATEPYDPAAMPARQPETVSTADRVGEPVGPPVVVAASGVQISEKAFSVDDIIQDCAPRLKAIPNRLPLQEFQQRAAQILLEEVRQRISQMLVVNEATRKLNEQQMAAIDLQMAEYKERIVADAGGSETKLDEQLRAEGTSLEEKIARQRDELIMRAYLNEKFMPAVTVNRRLLLAEYRRTLSKYSSPKMVQTQIIQVRPRSFLPEDVDSPTQAQQAAARAEAKSFAQKLLAKLTDGKTDFGAEARELAKKGMGGVLASEGGIWPEPRQPESIRPEQVGLAVDKLDEGQIAGVIETERGFYIVRAYKVVPAKVTPFEEAQKGIEERMRNEQYNRMVSEYMQGLYKGLLGMDSERFIRQALARAQELYYQK